jgi:hypothetical protein
VLLIFLQVKVLLSKHVIISDEPTQEAVYNANADQSVRCTAFSIAVSNGHQAIAALLIEAGELHFSVLCS